MNCVNWNCSGLRNPRRVQELFDIVKAKDPNLIFLMETKKKSAYLERVRCRLKFDNLFVIPQRHLSEGLALFWKNELDLHIRTFSPHHIDAVVKPRIDDTWRFMGFYGAPETVNREDSWSLLRCLNSQLDFPWVCIGDFNKITRLDEKLGGAIRPEKQKQAFCDCLDFCGLKDLGFTSLPFTWSNRRFDGPLVWVRLDRTTASVDWLLNFPSVRLHRLPGYSSNHKPIWLCSDDVHSRFYCPQNPFHFEAMWLKDGGCEGVVHLAWDLSSTDDPVGKVMDKVSNCQTQLISWNKHVFSNICLALTRKRKMLAKAGVEAISGRRSGQVKNLLAEINKLMDMESCMWNQRSKSDWLRDGDQNS